LRNGVIEGGAKNLRQHGEVHQDDRTPKIPFIHSRASWQLALLTTLSIDTGIIIPYTWLGKQLDMHHLPPVYYLWLVGTIFAYMLLATLMRKIFVWKYGELL
jgi:Mg2+-importing ATPase